MHFWTKQPSRPRRCINRENCIPTTIKKRKRKLFFPTQPYRSGRSINSEPQGREISGAAVYYQRGIAVYPQQKKTQAKAPIDDTVGSTGVVYQPRSWISTALETKANALLVDTALSTKPVYQPRSAKHKHL